MNPVNNRPIITRTGDSGPRLLFLEPYLAASHHALARLLMRKIPARWALLALPGRHFRWRMRGAHAFWTLDEAARALLHEPWDGIIASDMLNLAELRGLAPGLANVPALLYFHENQLCYPTPGKAGKKQRERDLFLGMTNLISALSAEMVAFNSAYHREAFLNAGEDLLRSLPGYAPPGLVEKVSDKSLVLPVPLDVSAAEGLERKSRSGALRILWNHRWEHDKNPEEFFDALNEIAAQGLEFEAAVLGMRAASWPKVFDRAKRDLGSRLARWGPVDKTRDYWKWLFWADVEVSTALQEFQGVSVAEAVWAGCRPLLPNRLAYPGQYPKECLYDEGDLEKRLAALCRDPGKVRQEAYVKPKQDYTWRHLEPKWAEALERLVRFAA